MRNREEHFCIQRSTPKYTFFLTRSLMNSPKAVNGAWTASGKWSNHSLGLIVDSSKRSARPGSWESWVVSMLLLTSMTVAPGTLNLRVENLGDGQKYFPKSQFQEVLCSFTSYWEENEPPRKRDDIFPLRSIWSWSLASRETSLRTYYSSNQMLSTVIFQTPCPDPFQLPGVSQDLRGDSHFSISQNRHQARRITN